MKITLSAAYVSLVILMTGCASVDVKQESSSNATTTTTAKATPSATQAPRTSSAYQHTPLYPGMALSPIESSDLTGNSVTALEAPQDMWDRIRRGFAMPNLQNDLVQDREQWYSSRPDYIQRMTERSSKYIFHIVEELERRNMPTELALLPYVESAFNPHAVSTAKAAGMWQFMPATGQYFSLKQNAFRDDRLDVLASTKAALDYLQKLYGMFGDWHLALAAYNWGEGSVSRAITKNQKAGLPTGYTDLNMPAETRLYIPKLQAIKNIVARPEAFQTELPLIENHPYFQKVEIKNDIDVDLVAKLAEIRPADFRALNPSFNKPVIFSAGTPEILLPWDNAKVFRANLEAYTQGQHASWTVWSVPKTMTVSEAAKHADMSEAQLRSMNGIPPRMLIKAGSALIVTRSSSIHNNVSSHLADNGQVAFAPEVVTKRQTIKTRSGDTVASIAKRYNVNASDVANWNDIKVTSNLKKGQSLVLNLVVQASKKSTRSASASSRVSTKSSTRVAKSTGNASKSKPRASNRKTATITVASATRSTGSSAKIRR